MSASEFGFGRAHQQRVAQFRIALAEIEPAEDSAPRQRREHRRDAADPGAARPRESAAP